MAQHWFARPQPGNWPDIDEAGPGGTGRRQAETGWTRARVLSGQDMRYTRRRKFAFLIDETTGPLRRLDVLVNNAGYHPPLPRHNQTTQRVFPQEVMARGLARRPRWS